MTERTEPRGFVLASSGEGFAPIAFHAGRYLREVHPDALIDFYTDEEGLDPGPFDRIVPLERSWHRPKFEALRRTRFERTIYVDTDVITLADLTDVFDVLDRFDIAGAHGDRRGNEFNSRSWRSSVPPAFPQMNSGVMGVKTSPAILKLWEETEAALAEPEQKKDQIPLRELLYDSDLRIATLPVEYNLVSLRQVDAMKVGYAAAPRVLHLHRLHKHLRRDMPQETDLATLVGHGRLARIAKLLESDVTLKGRNVADLSRWRRGWRARLADLTVR
ncbi:putative nucleotide-diphospho-sugar transferase [Aestuariibius sp. 2305UL40-4]|uniref:putative nucleotide-diphospho-sugar transferase n=1 Tax=Aestuariibius violaceus TaxID=3234132 RepID=UPI00345F0ADB